MFWLRIESQNWYPEWISDVQNMWKLGTTLVSTLNDWKVIFYPPLTSAILDVRVFPLHGEVMKNSLRYQDKPKLIPSPMSPLHSVMS